MADETTGFNLAQELAGIPPEYQDAFRQALARELVDTEQQRTDGDILAYLRRRRDDFERGGFIRPDGRPGLVTLDPETMYEQALPELAQSSLGGDVEQLARRRTWLKLGGFLLLLLLFLGLALRGRAQRAADAAADAANATATAAAGTPGVATPAAAGTALPTPPLPALTGAEDALQTIGGLGGALTIGRPSALEIVYGGSEETIALAIDPSQPTTKGELRYDEATMLSDNPVAVWLFGTVLNYAIGLPDSLVRNLVPGDRITLSSDTGAALQFIVTETRPGTNYEAARLLSQNRLGLTLFALPATAAEDVAYAFAAYDIAGEEGAAQPAYGVGERVPLAPAGSSAPAGQLALTGVQFSHLADGQLAVQLQGTLANLAAGQSVLLSLTAGTQQTAVVPLPPAAADGSWQTALALPGEVAGAPLMAEIRLLPGGRPAMVQLGAVPQLTNQLQISVTAAYQEPAAGQAVLQLAVFNPGPGAVYLGPDFLQTLNQGGDAYAPAGQVLPRLPQLIGPEESVGLTWTFSPSDTPVQLQIGADLWLLEGLLSTTP